MGVEELEKAQQGRVTGIIIPPPDIRAVCDKTATFVAKFGKSFEQKVMASEEGKTLKFSFLKPFDPYHAYYENRIMEIEEGKAATADAPALSAAPAPVKVKPTEDVKVSSSIAKASVANPLAKLALNKPTEAPPPFEFSLGHPSNMSALDSEIIKTTAQYTAVNGRAFLSVLAKREQHNPQFEFLKPTNIMFSYFTSMVDAYSKCIAPSSVLRQRIVEKCDRVQALEASVKRWQYNTDEAEKRARESAKEDAERMAFQQIDWTDFVVVETVDFDVDELLELESMNVNEEARQEDDGALPPPPPPPPMEEEEEEEPVEIDSTLNVVSDYTPLIAGAPGAATSASKQASTMLDPVSGKVIQISEMSEHMRIQLLDSRWKTEQQKFLEKQKDTGLAEGASIADSLKNFASRRGDIFGTAEQQQEKLLAEEARRKKRIEETNEIIRAEQSQGRSAAATAKSTSVKGLLPSGSGTNTLSKLNYSGIIKSASSSVSAPPIPAGTPLPKPPAAPMTARVLPSPVIPVTQPVHAVPAVPAVPVAAIVAGPVGGEADTARIPIPQVQGRASIMPAWMTQQSQAPSGIPAVTVPVVSTSASVHPPSTVVAPVPTPVPALSLRPAISSAPSFGAIPPPPPPTAVSAPIPGPLPARESPPPVPFVGARPSTMPPPPPMSMLPPSTTEQQQQLPAAKRIKELISEESFLSMYGNQKDFAVTILVPLAAVNLGIGQGQYDSHQQKVELTVPSLSSTIKEIKDLLCAQMANIIASTSGAAPVPALAANKIQLKDTMSGGFLKDANTLASYNLNAGAVLEFSLKTRGGKK